MRYCLVSGLVILQHHNSVESVSQCATKSHPVVECASGIVFFQVYGMDMEKEIGVGLQANGEYRGRCCAHMDAIYWVKR